VIDYQRIFHTGVRVPDLDVAMKELGDALGVEWASPCEWDQPVWTPDRGAEAFPLRFTYSTEGPQHVELLQGAPGSVWHAGSAPGVHHVGVWVDDVAADTQRLLDDGWSVVAAAASPEAGWGGFTYVAPPHGTIVELVDARALPRFEAWWAGGSLR
jgi:lactoylglutathione lyase